MDFLQGASIEFATLWDFLYALFIGALVGVERERKLERDPHQFGGLRTFTVIALVGALAAHLSAVLDTPLVFVGGIAGVSAFIAVAYFLESRHTSAMPGLTGEFAALATYMLAGAAVAGERVIAVMLAVVLSALLTFKQDLHKVVHGMNRDDLVAGLKLLFATFIVLPLLPNEPIDPWGALVPYTLWWLVVLISGLSLIGYVAVRLLGERRGMVLTGLAGGLASSTAVTLTFARRSNEPRAQVPMVALGLVLAWAIMFVRVIVEVAVVHAPLLRTLAAPMSAMFLVAGAYAGWRYWRASPEERARARPHPDQEDDDEDVELKNPFSLTSAVQFGLLFAAVLLVVELARQYVSDEWLYGIAVLAGATDVDAITLSLSDQASRGLDAQVAALSILLATLSNTVVKAGMVAVLGAKALTARVMGITLGICAVGVLVWFAQGAVLGG